MIPAIGNIRKTRGRPPVGSTPIGLRLLPDQLKRLDAWIAAQPDALSRPEAIRQLIGAGLRAEGEAPKAKKAR